MENTLPPIEALMHSKGFDPTPEQADAICQLEGPLYLRAGPGSGKTRVLLWRTLNLIAYKGVKPEEIYLSTFTEKAALQLREGLRGLLSFATEHNGKHYDISKMYVGTVHSLCQVLISDRRFSPGHQRPAQPVLLDDLDQYLYLYRPRRWRKLCENIRWEASANEDITGLLKEPWEYPTTSRHKAVSKSIAFFNRISEECIDASDVRRKARNASLRRLLDLYAEYKTSLSEVTPQLTDFSLLQQRALDALDDLDRHQGNPASGSVLKYIIIDEYQDTNTVQERLFFKLAAGYKNICVVGDDDQALYRFRGATVENFVEFKDRCKKNLGVKPKEIDLSVNFRSLPPIVDFYGHFVNHEWCDWRKSKGRGKYRVEKKITAQRDYTSAAVITTEREEKEVVFAQIARLVRKIIDEGKVKDANEIAFLYPSLKAACVQPMIQALEHEKLKVYAPRAGTFLDVPESLAMFGLMLHVFGRPKREAFRGNDYEEFHNWMDEASAFARELIGKDGRMEAMVARARDEIKQVVRDYKILLKQLHRRGWELKTVCTTPEIAAQLARTSGLSTRAQRSLNGRHTKRLIYERAAATSPRLVTLAYLINRATSLDWTLLDLFYQFSFFKHFRVMFEAAEATNKDEGPICNLSLISQYISRFMDEYNFTVLTGEFLADHKFRNVFISSYLFALYRRGESEYEFTEDPFPRGRIPFLTIHQAKGLEFPVVVLGNLAKQAKLQIVEQVVHPLLDPERETEPLDRMATFDVMRMFYVALSRPKNLLVLANFKGGQRIEPFKDLVDEEQMPLVSEFKVSSLPDPEPKSKDLPKNYSYTGDYLLYKRCPRQYMLYRKYDFAPSRAQTMFFGNLVHQTIEDLHQHLIATRSNQNAQSNA